VAWIEPRKDSKFTVRYRDGYGRAAKKRWRVFATETEAREFKRRADAIEMHVRRPPGGSFHVCGLRRVGLRDGGGLPGGTVRTS